MLHYLGQPRAEQLKRLLWTDKGLHTQTPSPCKHIDNTAAEDASYAFVLVADARRQRERLGLLPKLETGFHEAFGPSSSLSGTVGVALATNFLRGRHPPLGKGHLRAPSIHASANLHEHGNHLHWAAVEAGCRAEHTSRKLLACLYLAALRREEAVFWSNFDISSKA